MKKQFYVLGFVFAVLLIATSSYGQVSWSGSQVIQTIEPHELSFADFDNDGDEDVLVLHASHSSMSLLKNDGYGVFSVFDTIATYAYPCPPAIADFNNDGNLDFAQTHSNGWHGYDEVTVHLGNGDGSFQPYQLYQNLYGFFDYHIASGDVNGDSFIDLAFTSAGAPDGFALLINNGDGTFIEGNNYPAGAETGSIKLIDINNDGNLDAVIGCGGFGSGYQMDVYFGNGDATFSNRATFPSPISGANVEIRGFSDVDGDNDLDLIINLHKTNNLALYVMINDGTGNFTYEAVEAGGWNYAHFLDWNNDGHQDILDNKYNDGIERYTETAVFINDGSGNYSEKIVLNENHDRHYSPSDFDNDGHIDIAGNYWESDSVYIYLQEGSSENPEEIIGIDLESSGYDGNHILLDYNGDEMVDLITFTHSSQKMKFYNNTGGNLEFDFEIDMHSYSNTFFHALYGVNVDIFYRDIDLDGAKDLLVYAANHSNCSSNNIRVYWGNSTTYFTNDDYHDFSANSAFCVGAAYVDFDNDGLTDIHIRSASGVCTMYKNNGNRSFSKVSTFNTGRDINQFFFDIDNDGIKDLVYGKSGWADNQWGFRYNLGIGDGDYIGATVSHYTQEKAMDWNTCPININPIEDEKMDFAFLCKNDGTNSNQLYIAQWDSQISDFTFSTQNFGTTYVDHAILSPLDYNEDGYTDLVMRYRNYASAPQCFTTYVLENDGLGNFSVSDTLINNERYYSTSAWVEDSKLYLGVLKQNDNGNVWDSLFVLKYLLNNETTPNRLFITQTGSGSQNGSSWGNAMDSTQVQYAINQQKDRDSGEVWIAEGIYHPTDTILGTVASGLSGADSLRMRGFSFYPNVAVYGGFAGTESTVDERDIESHKTILSGDFSRNDEWIDDWAEGQSQGNLLAALQIALPDTALLSDTLLMMENAFHVAYIPPGTDSTCVLNGLVFANGYGRLGTQDINGGGLFSSETSSPTVDSCVFVGNVAVDGGGAFVYDGQFTNCEFRNNATFRIEEELNPLDGYGAGLYSAGGQFDDCLFKSNKSPSYGGGIYGTGGYFNNCEILFNRLAEGGQGAGICVNGGGEFYNSEIAYNKTAPTGNGAGGGVMAHEDGYFENCIIHSNAVSNDVNSPGGGIAMWKWGKAVNCKIFNNKSLQGGGAYSGLAAYYIDCAIYNNEAEDGGGYFSNSNGIVINSTIVNNKGSVNTGGALVHAGGMVKNSLIWNNTTADTSCQLKAHNVFGIIPGIYNCAIQDTSYGELQMENCFYISSDNQGNLPDEEYAGLASPINFIGNAQTEEQLQELINADFSLTAISACINAGADDNNIPDLDLNGNPRIFEDIVDIGACEYQEEINIPMVIHINTNHDDEGETTMTLPLYGDVDVTVDWGDGSTENITSVGQALHTYDEEGEYAIEIRGSLTQFGNGGGGYYGAQLIDSVSSWGTLGLTSLTGAFFDAGFLIKVPDSVPQNVNDLSHMFTLTLSFNQDIGGWDVSFATNMAEMFHSSTSFNKPLSNWDVSSVIDMSFMFCGAESFNQDIENWNVGSVVNMVGMFSGASSFNQDISSWNVENVTDFTDFLNYSTLSTENYNAILTSWSQQNVHANLNFHGGNSQYSCGLPAEARQSLIDNHGWTITDGGVDPASTVNINAVNTSQQADHSYTITVAASGGTGTLYYSIDNGQSWENNNGIFDGLYGGTYNIAVKDENECMESYDNNPVVLSHFNPIWSGNPHNPMMVIVSAAFIQQNNLQPGDEIGIFDADRCVGSAVLSQVIDSLDNSSFANIICSADDANQNGYDGFVPGNEVEYRLWDSSEQEEYTVIDATYPHDPLYKLEQFTENETSIVQLNGLRTSTLFQIADAAACQGDTLRLEIHTEGMHDVDSLVLSISYDPTTLQYVSCSNVNSAITSNSVAANSGQIDFIGTGTDMEVPMGSLFTLNFVTQPGQSGSTDPEIQGSAWCYRGPTVFTWPTSFENGNALIRPLPQITQVNTVPVTGCHGDANGEISITATANTTDIYYSINAGDTWALNQSNFTNLVASEYTITVKDTFSCQSDYANNPVTITEPTAVAITEVSSTEPLCNGSNEGSITVTATGGTGTLQYSIDNGANWQNGNQFASLTAGDYNITVKDENDCQTDYANNPVTITEPTAVAISEVTTTEPLCYGSNEGSITVTATGGTGTLQYSIDNGANWQAGNQFSSLTAGDYNITVKDENDCQTNYANNPVTITEPTAVAISEVTTTEPLCNGSNEGTIAITATGGTGSLLYSIDNGANWQNSNQFANLTAGDYNITVKDENDCQTAYANNPVTITEPTAVAITEVTSTEPLCNGSNEGSITVTASGGTGSLQYSIDNGANWQAGNQFSSLTAGDYNITVKDENDCQTNYANNPVTITEPTAVAISEVTTTEPLCNGSNEGTIAITATGGTGSLLYSIDNGANWQNSNQIANLTAGDYNITVKDENDCQTAYANNPVTITEPTAVAISEVTTTEPLCNGSNEGSITVTATGGTGTLQYSIDNGANWQAGNQFASLTAGDYNITVKDENDCQTDYANNPVTISEPTAVAISEVTTTEPLCYGSNEGSITVTATGGTGTLQYSFDNGANWQAGNQFSSLTAGDYNITVKDENDCQTNYANNPVTITEPTAVAISEVTTTEPLCNGSNEGTIAITATGGTGSLLYSIDNGANWQNSNQFANLTAGDYNITVKDENDCQTAYANNPVTITEPTAVAITEVTSTEPLCNGSNEGSITVTASGGTGSLQYSIDNGANWQAGNQFSSLTAGDYNITVKDENDCQTAYANNPVTITEPTAVAITEVTSTEPLCNGSNEGSITITATGGTGTLQYSIDNGANWQAGNQFAGLTAGDYNITVKDENDCQTNYANNPVTITEPTAVAISEVTITEPLCNGSNEGTIAITATGGTGTLQYSIDNGTNWQAGNQFASLTAGDYNITVKDENDCQTDYANNPVTITEPTPIEILEVSFNKETYRGASDASISINAAGGTEPLQYSVDGGFSWFSNEGLFTALDSGDYHISVRDANLCEYAYVNNPVLIPGVHFDRVWSGNPLNPMYFSITHAMAEEMNLEWMDEIAIYDGNICVGTVVLTQSIDSLNNTTYAAINCSQDENGTPQKEGYTPGNTIHYRMWDESSQEEYIYVHAEYPFTPNYAHTTFVSGETDIVQLYAQQGVAQPLSLSQGWNIISWNVVPIEMSMDSLVSPLISEGSLSKVIDERGYIIQELPWGWVNMIGDMQQTEGYQVKVNTATTFATNGYAVLLPMEIPFYPSWNIMSWPMQASGDAENAMQEIINQGKLVKVIDQSGGILQQLPWGWVNTIGDFEPGQGYQVKVSGNCTLNLDETAGDYKSYSMPQPQARMLRTASKGNPYNPMTFAIQSNGTLPQNSEIGVYKNGQCFGAAVLTGEYIYISAGTDEADTEEKEGFRPGDAFTFKYITEGMQEPLELEVTWLQGDKTYTERGTFVGEIKSLTAAEELQATVSWIGEARPNPARDEVFVDYYLNADASLSWQMVDAQGRVLLQGQKESPQGRQQQGFDLSTLPSGIYYLHLKAEGEGMFAEKVLRVVRL